MFDNQLFTLLISIMSNGFAQLGYAEISALPIVQSYQPVQEGINTGPTAYLHKLFDHRTGTPQWLDVWEPSVVATFQGWISGTTLTVTTLMTGTLANKLAITGDDIPANTFITAINDDGTYTINQTLQIATEDMQAIAGEVHTETQQYESHFQVSALSTQNPANQNQLTASDIANLASAILQSEQTITTLENQGLGILRITDVRNDYFPDDRARFEASPTFDFVVTHKQVITNIVPIVLAEEFQLISV